jgi:hypothetical protein
MNFERIMVMHILKRKNNKIKTLKIAAKDHVLQ